jgi:CTP synthase
MDEGHVIAAPDVAQIYDVPLMFEKEGLSTKLLKDLQLKPRSIAPAKNPLKKLEKLVKTINSTKKTVRIAVVGKYFQTGAFVLADSYISVIEALKHATWSFGQKPELVWLDAEAYEKNPKQLKELSQFDGVLIPGGFGSRGVEGKILAIQYVREHKIPYFGLCYGMQLAAIEVARHVAKLKGAHTVEIDESPAHPIIIVNPHQKANIVEQKYGGTMRLGAYDCDLKAGTKTQKAYGARSISERHRHRYEFNNDYLSRLEDAGLMVSGVNPQQNLVEIMELKDHPWFVGTQFHPEFLSRPLRPHPLFVGFVGASIKRRDSKK